MKEIVLKEILNEVMFDSDKPNVDAKQILLAMKIACRQTLELAANNARCDAPFGVDVSHIINKQSILDTINQIK